MGFAQIYCLWPLREFSNQIDGNSFNCPKLNFFYIDCLKPNLLCLEKKLSLDTLSYIR